MSFSDKVVVVTGSSGGIGAAIALKFAEQGAHVVLNGRSDAKVSAMYELCCSVGKPPFPFVGDVTVEDDARRLIDDTVAAFGRLDVLVNNAGILRLAPVLGGNLLETYDEVVATNLRPVVHLTGLAAPHLMATQGSIINISSLAGKKPVVGLSCYGLSKAAVNLFTKTVALELGPCGVRVNSISPGVVSTDIAANAGLSREEADAGRTWSEPLGRVSTPDEVADLALFLASEKAVGITGADFVVDNGTQLT